MVGLNLHIPRAEKPDPYPREIDAELRGSTRLRVVIDRVACHLEVTYRVRRESYEEHAPRAARDVVADDLRVLGFRACHVSPHDTGTAHIVGEDLRTGRVIDEHAEPVAYEVIPRDGGIEASIDSLDRVMAFRVASDNILHDRGARTGLGNDAIGVGFRAAYNMVVRDSGVDAPASDDPPSDIAYETVSHNSSVASAVKLDHGRRAVPAPDREARNAHIAHTLPGELAGFDVHVAEDANSLRSKSL